MVLPDIGSPNPDDLGETSKFLGEIPARLGEIPNILGVLSVITALVRGSNLEKGRFEPMQDRRRFAASTILPHHAVATTGHGGFSHGRLSLSDGRHKRSRRKSTHVQTIETTAHGVSQDHGWSASTPTRMPFMKMVIEVSMRVCLMAHPPSAR